MRGYFDGDGSICYTTRKCNYKEGTFSVIGTPEFLDEYEKYILQCLNRNNPNKRDKSGRAEAIRYGGKNQIKKIFQFLYKDATIYLQRKYDKFNIVMPSQDETDNNLEMISAELSGETVKSRDTQPEPKANSDISQGQRVDSDPSTDDRRV